jgi:hypothetical protein
MSSAVVGGAQTVADTLSHLLPGEAAAMALDWPADLFAASASLLKQSGAYAEIANHWPPRPYTSVGRWHENAVSIRRAWRRRFNSGRSGMPPQVERWWKTVLRERNRSVAEIGAVPGLVEALVGIVAATDQTCHGVGVPEAKQDKFDDRALTLLTLRNTLCDRIDPSRATVLPKLHNPLDGMTLRSLTHNLALWDRPEVKAVWSQLAVPSIDAGVKALLFPWPLVMEPSALHEVPAQREAQMPKQFGLFTYDMSAKPIDIARVKMLLKRAERLVDRIDALIFPELSLTDRDFERVLAVANGRLIIAGVGTPAPAGGLGGNDVAIAVASDDGGRFRQSKHHRWRLDRGQLDRYGVGAAFGDRDSWWEAIRLAPRQCAFFTVNNWLTFCALICEDLARQDPVAELVRCVGPNLVVALLMDGPQIPDRWSARYATVLAEDPRSSVLTLTSAGLLDLARAQYGGGPRSIGLWKDALSSSARQIVLEAGAEAIVLRMTSRMKKEWTADGRHDDGTTGYLGLSGIYQVFPS